MNRSQCKRRWLSEFGSIGIAINIENDENMNYIQKSMSSEDFVSELQVNMVNVTNNRSENVNNYVSMLLPHGKAAQRYYIFFIYAIYAILLLRIFFNN